MRLLIIVYNDLWDACFPVIESLKDKCDLYCALELIPEHANILSIKPKDFKGDSIIPSKKIPGIEKYSEVLPVEQTSIIRKHFPKRIIRFVKDSIIEKKFIDRVDPDFVLFYHDPIYSLSYINNASQPWGIAVHDPIPHDGGRTVINLLRKNIFKKCKNFFLFSQGLISEFKKKYELSDAKVFSTRLGVYSHLSSLYGMPEIESTNVGGPLRLLFFGKIQPYKGLRYLLEAYKQLKNDGIDVELTIAGKGNIENDIIPLTQENGIYIENGFIEEKKLADYIINCDLVVCPYVEATQSGVIMTAFAFCIPVIATNVGGLAEMVEDNITGRVIQPSNVQVLTDVLADVCSHREKLVGWRKKIHEIYYSGNQSREIITAKLLSDINTILNNEDKNN